LAVNQRYSTCKLSDTQTSNMIEFAVTLPKERKSNMMVLAQLLGFILIDDIVRTNKKFRGSAMFVDLYIKIESLAGHAFRHTCKVNFNNLQAFLAGQVSWTNESIDSNIPLACVRRKAVKR
jgi:hypothetical protein